MPSSRCGLEGKQSAGSCCTSLHVPSLPWTSVPKASNPWTHTLPSTTSIQYKNVLAVVHRSNREISELLPSPLLPWLRTIYLGAPHRHSTFLPRHAKTALLHPFRPVSRTVRLQGYPSFRPDIRQKHLRHHRSAALIRHLDSLQKTHRSNDLTCQCTLNACCIADRVVFTLAFALLSASLASSTVLISNTRTSRLFRNTVTSIKATSLCSSGDTTQTMLGSLFIDASDIPSELPQRSTRLS